MSVYSVVGTGTCVVCADPFPTKDGRWKAGRKYCGSQCRQKAWGRRWPERVRANSLSFRATHPDYMRTSLLMRYGIALEQYESMLVEQSGLCAICRQPETHRYRKTGAVVALGVDHNHSTGAVRGLLCKDCNRGIGAFGDSADRVDHAARYLRRYE